MTDYSTETPMPRTNATRRGCTTPRALVVSIALVAGTLAAGCGSAVVEAKTPPGAALFFEPVGPLEAVWYGSSPVEAAEDSSESPAARLRSRGGSGPHIPDSKLRLDVGSKLRASTFELGGVSLQVDDQSVELRGEVASIEARDRAELLARSARGVVEVRNEIRVVEVSDEQLE